MGARASCLIVLTCFSLKISNISSDLFNLNIWDSVDFWLGFVSEKLKLRLTASLVVGPGKRDKKSTEIRGGGFLLPQ